jgi:NADPH-dependent 2,4-dienoyl-CoA reductase/sulfur reductase-like enzyme/peroxiredoxin family protein/rhodanese-related sulfurtransferase/TusA-related sulfurtransferase
MSKKVLIVGGVAGGASAAARLRRLDEKAEIILFERGEYISFANCGLPYYIGGTIKERNNLLVSTPKDMKDKFNVDVRTNSEVTKVNSDKKELIINDGEKTYTENYDYLILSPGAKPITPPIQGIDGERIFSLRNMADTDKIKTYVTANKLNSAVVIGGGFIGIEMAENLIELGIKVSLVEAAPHILAPFDSDMVTIAEKEMQDNGVSLFLNNKVCKFEDKDGKTVISLEDGSTISSDMVILAIGVTPDVNFLKDTALEFGPKGHIVVNEKMETNLENIYAVGDAVEIIDFVNKNKTAIPLAGPANKQGRIAADNIMGLSRTFKGSQGTSILKVFDLTCASTGSNERTLTNLNIPYKVIYVLPQSHASYYPGATPMTLKLIFNMEGKVLGAQGIGYEGVDKRIDDIAVVIRLNGTIYDLSELELAYAPPYSSAKDPVNMLGFYAENIIEKRSETVLPREVDTLDPEKVVLLDIRTELEAEGGQIPNSVHIPLEQLRDRLDELEQYKDKELWAYCQVGLRGYIAERALKANGFNVKNITGGYKVYMAGKFEPNVNVCEVVNSEETKVDTSNAVFKNLDACGLSCPGPLMRVKSSMDELNNGDNLVVTASDPGFYEDIKAWSKRTNNTLMNVCKEKGIITATIKKGTDEAAVTVASNAVVEVKDNKTMVVFSGDLDKAIASFIIANGAAAMGKKVTMFFTFWGINILRKNENVSVSKNIVEKMFGMMMPRGSKKLGLSTMNMGGMGAKMIRGIMKQHNVSSLEELIEAAIDSGIEIVACQMSMDLLGLKQEELIDGIKIGGVGYYLGEAEDSNVNLFI